MATLSVLFVSLLLFVAPMLNPASAIALVFLSLLKNSLLHVELGFADLLDKVPGPLVICSLAATTEWLNPQDCGFFGCSTNLLCRYP